MHEAEDVDEAGDDDDEDGEWRHEVADEDGRRDEHAQRRQAEVAVELLGYHLVSLPAWIEQLGIFFVPILALISCIVAKWHGWDYIFFLQLSYQLMPRRWDSNPSQ